MHHYRQTYAKIKHKTTTVIQTTGVKMNRTIAVVFTTWTLERKEK